MSITTEKKKEIFEEFGGNETNTGSVEAQVALLSHRINHISDHLKSHRKDHSSTRSLYKMVGAKKKITQLSVSQRHYKISLYSGEIKVEKIRNTYLYKASMHSLCSFKIN